MKSEFRVGLVVVVLASLFVFPVILHAGFRHRHCHKCRKAQPECCCPRFIPEPMPNLSVINPCVTNPCPAPAALQPIVETQMIQRPVMKQRDIPTTEYHVEPVCELVPRTVYEKRISYRCVPHQVNRRVTECVTETVPFQTIRYAPAGTGGFSSGGTLGLTPSNMPPMSPTGPRLPPVPSTMNYNPGFGSGPSFGMSPSSQPTAVAIPLPSSDYDSPTNGSSYGPGSRIGSEPGTTPIMPRTARRDYETTRRDYGDSYEPTRPSHEARPASRSNSMFVPAPSAAAVWQTPRSR